MSLLDKTLGASPKDIWGSVYGRFAVPIGKFEISNFKGARWGQLTIAAGGTADIRPPVGENWLIVWLSSRLATTFFKLCDGTNMDGVGIITSPIGYNTSLLPISNSLFIRANNAGATLDAVGYFAFVLPDGFSVIGSVTSIAADTTVSNLLVQTSGKHRILIAATTRGDGTNSGTIIAGLVTGAVGTGDVTLASGTGDVRYVGARAEFGHIQIRNESASALYCAVLGLEVTPPLSA